MGAQRERERKEKEETKNVDGEETVPHFKKLSMRFLLKVQNKHFNTTAGVTVERAG